MVRSYFGPIYCETPLYSPELSGVLLEPINALTSVFLVVAAVIAALYIWAHRSKWNDPFDIGLYIFSLLLLSAGVGSFFWHGFRTDHALAFDVLPSLWLIILFLFLWLERIYNRWVAYGFFLFLAGIQFLILYLVSIPDTAGLAVKGYLPLVLVILFIISLTIKRCRDIFRRTLSLCGKAHRWIICASILALFAIILRLVDLYVCNLFPLGTHFLWHTFLALASLSAVVFLVRLKALYPHQP